MAVELLTIPGVPIVRTGTYQLASGDRAFTEEDLRDAADAWANDPAVKNPRIRIASLAAALNLDPGEHGGEPAFGYFDNLRVSEDGQELLADAHVPEAVRAGMEWAFPSLSIEGREPGWTSATGRSYGLVVTAVALLGVHWPGVTTLDDLTAFLADGPAELQSTETEPQEVLATMPQRARPPAASLDSDLVARRFIDAVDGGQLELPEGVGSSWDLWIRAMRFDDSGSPYLKVTDESSGTLYRVDFTVSGADVTFGDFTEVVEQDVPVAAGMARPAAPLATYADREAFRAVAATTNDPEEGTSMTDEQRRSLAERHGLDPETASEGEVLDAVMAAPQGSEQGGTNGADDEGDAGDGGGQEGTEEGQGAEGSQQLPVAARGVPEGVVMIDAEELERLRSGAQTAQTLAATAAQQERDQVIRAAIEQGRIPRSRTEAYATMWDRDPEGTRHLLTASEAEGGLAPNTIPVAARGVEPQDELVSASEEHDAYMARHFPQAAAARGGRIRHRQEV